jgi:hypothetical protein
MPIEEPSEEIFTNKAKAERMRARAEGVQSLADGYRKDADSTENPEEKEILLNSAKILDKEAKDRREEAERLESLK